MNFFFREKYLDIHIVDFPNDIRNFRVVRKPKNAKHRHVAIDNDYFHMTTIRLI